MAVIHNEVESYQGNQLAVELRDAGIVQQELQHLGILATEIDSSDSLSLKLLELDKVESAAAVLRQDSALVADASRDRSARGQIGDGIKDLDLVLFALRRSARQAYDGWVPTVGKNRILGQVQGSPYIKGAVGKPTKIPHLSIPPIPQQAGARVAILDTRLYRHPDLAGRYLGESVADFPPPQRTTQAHATFIAGLVAQRAPGAELVVRQVLDDDGSNASSWDVAKEMADILTASVAVLNLSLGCATIDRVAPLCLTRAVERLIPRVVVVAAAGNNGSPEQMAIAGLTINTPHYPAAIDGVVGVGAYDPQNATHTPALFSPKVPWVDLLAPGVGVPSTFLPGMVQPVRVDQAGHVTRQGEPVDFGRPGYATWDGTSFAAANVTGEIAARMASHHVSAHHAVEQLLAKPGPGADIVPYTEA